jgi:hypothetical protein
MAVKVPVFGRGVGVEISRKLTAQHTAGLGTDKDGTSLCRVANLDFFL